MGLWKDRFKCSRCREQPNLRDIYGCEKPTLLNEPTFDEPDGVLVTVAEMPEGLMRRFWECPVRWVPRSVNEFLRVYGYHKQFPGAAMPGLRDVSMRFLHAMEYYEGKVNMLTRAKAESGNASK